MANATDAFGLIPYLPNTEAMPLTVNKPIDSSNGDIMGIGDPVILEDDGNIGLCTAGDAVYGVIASVEDSNRIPVYSRGRNRALPASTAGFANVIPAHAGMLWRARANADAALTQTAVGQRYELEFPAAASQVTGYSGCKIESDNPSADHTVRMHALVDWEPTSVNDSTLASSEVIVEIMQIQTAAV